MNLLSQVRNNLRKHRLLPCGERILIGVSGGADSTALLHILAILRSEWGWYIHVAHLDHGLRAQAAQDAKFVERLARRLGIPCTCAYLPVKELKNKSSLEEVAREYRQQFLIETAKKQHCSKIVLAHTQDDLAETVLMRILRGTGLMGLRGILPQRNIGGATFVRPLLEIPKADILSFLKKERIPYRQDLSNRDLEFFRNKVRLKALPYLTRLCGKDVKPLLSRLAQTSAADYEFLQEAGEKALTQCRIAAKPKQILLKTDVLRSLHPALRRMVIRLALEDLQGRPGDWTWTTSSPLKGF